MFKCIKCRVAVVDLLAGVCGAHRPFKLEGMRPASKRLPQIVLLDIDQSRDVFLVHLLYIL